MPEGWLGPTILAQLDAGAKAPPCPDGWIAAMPAVLHDALVGPPPADCGCSCTLPVGEVCFSYLYSHEEGPCDDFIWQRHVDDTCRDVEAGPNITFGSYAQIVPQCVVEPTTELPAIAWQHDVTACVLADDATACDGDGRCEPTPPAAFEASRCIHHEGDIACPPGEYNTKRRYFTAFEDTRACGLCVCESVTDYDCAGEVQLFAEPGCTGEPFAATLPGNDCVAGEATSAIVDYGDAVNCGIAQPPAAFGTVEPTAPITVCCTD